MSNLRNLNATKDKPETCVQNKSENESNLNLDEEGNDVNKKDLEEEYSKTKRTASPEIPKKKLK